MNTASPKEKVVISLDWLLTCAGKIEFSKDFFPSPFLFDQGVYPQISQHKIAKNFRA
jgi:hypothetical protein